ncbi:DoxX family protein [Nitrospinae bacterium AH_259_B05_G02_I21]|nr:DoxX family protein [Nitrospinae bacterium AH_259_B05_G02_I21]
MLRRLLFGTDAGWWTLPLRVSLGLIFIGHGAQKLFGAFGGKGLQATADLFATKLGMTPGMLWAALASGGEFFGGLLVLVGFLTRFGAFNIAVVMLVAMTQVHWGAFFMPKGIEFTLALLGSSLALLIAGAGPLSLDMGFQQRGGEARRRTSRRRRRRRD